MAFCELCLILCLRSRKQHSFLRYISSFWTDFHAEVNENYEESWIDIFHLISIQPQSKQLHQILRIHNWTLELKRRNQDESNLPLFFSFCTDKSRKCPAATAIKSGIEERWKKKYIANEQKRIPSIIHHHHQRGWAEWSRKNKLFNKHLHNKSEAFCGTKKEVVKEEEEATEKKSHLDLKVYYISTLLLTPSHREPRSYDFSFLHHFDRPATVTL
jgi:hypothetical protein